jgi:hypothetical protein
LVVSCQFSEGRRESHTPGGRAPIVWLADRVSRLKPWKRRAEKRFLRRAANAAPSVEMSIFWGARDVEVKWFG